MIMNANNERLKLPKRVMIEWLDVMSMDSGLLDVKDLNEIRPAHAFIVGFLVGETKDSYYVAKEYWETGQFKYLHVIPKNTAIVSVKEL